MDYVKITDFLDKFKKILFKEEEIYKIISEMIFKYTSSETPINQIKIKGSTINLNCSPMKKSEVLIHKKQILDDLNTLSERKFRDIR